eukprot:s120_g3.t1
MSLVARNDPAEVLEDHELKQRFAFVDLTTPPRGTSSGGNGPSSPGTTILRPVPVAQQNAFLSSAQQCVAASSCTPCNALVPSNITPSSPGSTIWRPVPVTQQNAYVSSAQQSVAASRWTPCSALAPSNITQGHGEASFIASVPVQHSLGSPSQQDVPLMTPPRATSTCSSMAASAGGISPPRSTPSPMPWRPVVMGSFSSSMDGPPPFRLDVQMQAPRGRTWQGIAWCISLTVRQGVKKCFSRLNVSNGYRFCLCLLATFWRLQVPEPRLRSVAASEARGIQCKRRLMISFCPW